MKPSLALITANYPYRGRGGEIPFLKPEIPRLSRFFDVTVFPVEPTGDHLDPEAPRVDFSLASAMRKRVGHLVGSGIDLLPRLRRELIEHSTSLSIRGARELISFSAQYGSAKKWLRGTRFLESFDLAYTYWCTPITACLADHLENVPVVSRVHGYDLYESRRQLGFFPLRSSTYDKLDRIYCISSHGAEYLSSRSVSTSKLRVFRLGVAAQISQAKQSNDATFRVMSCSSVIPIKRVHLILEGLKQVCTDFPDQCLEWVHFGGGELLSELQCLAEAVPPNLVVHLRGHCANSDVIEHYRTEPVDLFVHASSTEGLPVSIQEAISFGVPVASTRVGGVPEIINESIGYLLDPRCAAAEIGRSVRRHLSLANAEKKRMRDLARSRQLEAFDEEVNHTAFARDLLEIVHRRGA